MNRRSQFLHIFNFFFILDIFLHVYNKKDHIDPFLPTYLSPLPNFIVFFLIPHYVHVLTSICAWVQDHVLGHRKPTSSHALNKQRFSLSRAYHSTYTVGPGEYLPMSARIWARKLLILMKCDLLIFFSFMVLNFALKKNLYVISKTLEKFCLLFIS